MLIGNFQFPRRTATTKAIKAVCFGNWNERLGTLYSGRTSGVLRLHPTSVYFGAPARKLFPSSEHLTPRQLIKPGRLAAVYILSARNNSVGHVYVHTQALTQLLRKQVQKIQQPTPIRLCCTA